MKQTKDELRYKLRVMEEALDECLRQFDYSGDMQWREDFKGMMIKHAENNLKQKDNRSLTLYYKNKEKRKERNRKRVIGIPYRELVKQTSSTIMRHGKRH